MSEAEVCVLGGAGFGAGELMRLLLNHPEIGSIRAVSRSHAGEPFHAAHPHLRGLLDGKFEADVDWGAWKAECPTVFSALPGLELARQYRNLDARWNAAELTERLLLIDLSGDFRLPDATSFARHYGEAHPCPKALGSFVYGLSEWKPQRIRNARRIANPGCFATAVELALLPLLGMPTLGRICVAALTGSSGSGTRPDTKTHHATRANDLRAYKVLKHQHLGEIQSLLGSAGTSAEVAFVAHSAPLVRGIFATVQLDLDSMGFDGDALRSKFEVYYRNARFVRLVDDSPRVAAVAGTNFCDIAVHASGSNAVVLAALDNLGKGMAGQAVQNLNLARGWAEDASLRLAAMYPA